MVDFRKMAEDARLAKEAAQQSESDKYNAEKASVASQRHRAEDALNVHVRPLLEQAAAGYAADGVHVTIEEAGQMHNPTYFVRPALKFSCWSKLRASDNYRMETASAFFATDGEGLWVGATDNGYEKEASKPVGNGPVEAGEVIILMGLQQVIEKHYEKASGVHW